MTSLHIYNKCFWAVVPLVVCSVKLSVKILYANDTGPRTRTSYMIACRYLLENYDILEMLKMAINHGIVGDSDCGSNNDWTACIH